MKGININCAEAPYVDMIFEGKKTIETRNSPTLRPYVGQIVGIIETGCGAAKLKGFVEILEEGRYDIKSDFRKDYLHHRVAAGSKYDFKTRKYGYVLRPIYQLPIPITIHSKGIVARDLPNVFCISEVTVII